MTWRGRWTVVLVVTLLLLAGAAAFSVVQQHRGGDCWPWQERTEVADGTFCDGKPLLSRRD